MQKLVLILLLFIVFFNGNAQQKDSLNIQNSEIQNNKLEFKAKHLYVPLSLMVAGLAIDGNGQNSIKNQVKDWRNEKMPNFRTHVDDVLQFAPLAATFGFEIVGMKPKTDFNNRAVIAIKSQVLTLGSVYVLKKAFNETRPDGTPLAFPSGHTAIAFSGAALLATEYGENYKWVPYVAYGTATTVGALRVANNRHYLSDVLFGAGLGILSTKLAYWTHQYRWNRKKSEKDPLAAIYQSQY